MTLHLTPAEAQSKIENIDKQMMDVRRKFLAGTISVLSLECHSSFMRLERWSMEDAAAMMTTS